MLSCSASPYPEGGGAAAAEGDRQEDPVGGNHGYVCMTACRTVPTFTCGSAAPFVATGVSASPCIKSVLKCCNIHWLAHTHGITLDAVCRAQQRSGSSILHNTSVPGDGSAGTVVYLQPTQDRIMPAVQHLHRCIAQHPEFGALRSQACTPARAHCTA